MVRNSLEARRTLEQPSMGLPVVIPVLVKEGDNSSEFRPVRERSNGCQRVRFSRHGAPEPNRSLYPLSPFRAVALDRGRVRPDSPKNLTGFYVRGATFGLKRMVVGNTAVFYRNLHSFIACELDGTSSPVAEQRSLPAAPQSPPFRPPA